MKRFHAALVALTLTGSIALAAGIASASAAETGTKTMPDSSIYPPRTPAPVFGSGPHHNYRYAGLSIITDTRDPITDTHDLTTRDLITDTQDSIITDTQDSIITDTRDPITRHSTGRARSGRTIITLPAIISLMTPTTAHPLKTWRRIVAGIDIIPTAGHVGTELRRTSRVADAMCHLTASALCDCRVRP